MKKTIIKVLFFNILTFTLIFMPNKDKCYAASDFTYTVKDNVATITSYKGTSGNVIIPSKIGKYKVTAIGAHAFDENRNSTNGKKLVNVVISEGITSIGDFAFVDCTNLVNLKLPQSLTYLGDQTFLRCTSLKKINIPPKVKSLGITGFMFQETGLESIVIPANVTDIPMATFRLCKKLKKIIIYSPRAEIYPDAFEYCSSDLVMQGYTGSTTQEYAKQNGYKFIPITINKNTTIHVKSITLSKKNITLEIGQKLVLKPTILPNNATNKNVRWASSNSNIVAVKNGTIFGKQTGTAKIAVATIDGNYKAFTSITVVDKGANSDNPKSTYDTLSSEEPNNKSDTSDSPKSTQEDIDTFYPSQTLTPSNATNTANSKRNKTKKAIENFISNNPIATILIIILIFSIPTIIILLLIIVFIKFAKKK